MKTKIEFLRAGLVTSLQGENINSIQHHGITTSGPMDYFPQNWQSDGK